MLFETHFIFMLFETNFVFMLFALMLVGNSPPAITISAFYDIWLKSRLISPRRITPRKVESYNQPIFWLYVDFNLDFCRRF